MLLLCAKLGRIVIFTAALPDDFEARDLRLVVVHLRRLLAQQLVPCYEYLRKAASEVSAVQVGGCLHAARLPAGSALVFLNHVNFIALRTEHFDTAAAELIAEADG